MKKYLALASATLLTVMSTAAFSNNAGKQKTIIEGAVEFAAGVSRDEAGENSNDLSLATVELSINTDINKNVSSHILFTYDEEDSGFYVDEATINLKIKDSYTIIAGQLYLPFGNFESNMISDTLPLALSDSRETAVQLDFNTGSLSTSVFFFNGDAKETGSSNAIDSFGFNSAYEKDDLIIGFSYTNNLTDSDTLTDVITAATGASDTLTNTIAGASVYANAKLGNTSVFIEYVSALDDIAAADFGGTTNATPSALNAEVSFDVGDSVYSVAYQASDEADDFNLPKTRFLASYSKDVMTDVSLTFEAASSKNEDSSKSSAVTAQLAISF